MSDAGRQLIVVCIVTAAAAAITSMLGDSTSIQLIRAGVLTTMQDRSRAGQQRYGIQPCGAMDWLSHRIGNTMVGNDDAAASLRSS
jgi:Carboxyltransferase domain, subdomain A and B